MSLSTRTRAGVFRAGGGGAGGRGSNVFSCLQVVKPAETLGLVALKPPTFFLFECCLAVFLGVMALLQYVCMCLVDGWAAGRRV